MIISTIRSTIITAFDTDHHFGVPAQKVAAVFPLEDWQLDRCPHRRADFWHFSSSSYLRRSSTSCSTEKFFSELREDGGLVLATAMVMVGKHGMINNQGLILIGIPSGWFLYCYISVAYILSVAGALFCEQHVVIHVCPHAPP